MRESGRKNRVSGRENIELLFKTHIDDIRYSKQQQWNVIYLTIIAISGIIALVLSLDGPDSKTLLSKSSFKYLLTVVCIGISFGGIYYIGLYHWSMTRYSYLKNIFRDALAQDPLSGVDYDKKDCARSNFFSIHFWNFVVPFCLVILAACVLGCYLIWYIKPAS